MAMPPERHPSGEQFDISQGGQRAVVTEVGATLRSYLVDGRPVIDGFGAGEVCSGGRGQVLMPWPNRVRDGTYAFAGVRHQLPLTEAERRNAIHGLVRWLPWALLDRTGDRVSLGLTMHPQPGYPFHLQLTLLYALEEDGLRIAASARNLGREAAPFGAGFHPYLLPVGGRVDGALLQIPARARLDLDQRLIPAGPPSPVAGTELDFRSPRRIGATILDTCFTELDQPWVELDDVRLWWDPAFAWVQAFTGDTLALEHRRRGLAVEPMTCPPDAYNSGRDLVVLEPGGEWSGSWGITLLR